MKILFVASEAYPYIQTGGLGDVCGSLPPALHALGCDVRLLLPAYRDAVDRAGNLKPIAQFTLPPLATPVTLLESRPARGGVPVWFLDFAPAFGRAGNPYHDAHGNPWPDNAARFALLSRAACALALGQTPLTWKPEIVHCHDWQTGLVPALLSREPRRPKTIFTIHNLAYRGLFPRETLNALGLPESWWSFGALEFHGELSFIKAGLVFADRIGTVSPSYAREIQTPEGGYGLDGLLRHRASRLVGILNGIDETTWDPARDPHLAVAYSARRLTGKGRNKAALRREFALATTPGAMLVGMIGRLVYQKGVDLALAALPALLRRDIQFVFLGSGDADLERELKDAAVRYPDRCATTIGYDERLAHRIVAGADALLMPSRFEPCGLSQLYAMRYGTVPIVRRVGGLADTVIDGETGVVFDAANPAALANAVEHALALYGNRPAWRKFMSAGMHQDFSWPHSAQEYLRLYRSVLRDA